MPAIPLVGVDFQPPFFLNFFFFFFSFFPDDAIKVALAIHEASHDQAILKSFRTHLTQWPAFFLQTFYIWFGQSSKPQHAHSGPSAAPEYIDDTFNFLVAQGRNIPSGDRLPGTLTEASFGSPAPKVYHTIQKHFVTLLENVSKADSAALRHELDDKKKTVEKLTTEMEALTLKQRGLGEVDLTKSLVLLKDGTTEFHSKVSVPTKSEVSFSILLRSATNDPVPNSLPFLVVEINYVRRSVQNPGFKVQPKVRPPSFAFVFPFFFLIFHFSFTPLSSDIHFHPCRLSSTTPRESAP